MYINVSNPNAASEFNQKSKKGYWIILYYANWCPHCQTMKPEWNKFSETVKNNKSVNVAEVESEFMDAIGPEHKANVQGFPTIVGCREGKKIADYTGPRTSDDMIKFTNDNNKTNHINNLLRKTMRKIKIKSKTKSKTKTKKSKTTGRKRTNRKKSRTSRK
jgi:thiol-disulfide isomerase/thioredoxin